MLLARHRKAREGHQTTSLDVAPDADTDASYDARKVDELRDLLKGRDLPTSGTKAELVARLVEADEQAAEAPVDVAPDADTEGDAA